MVRSLAIHANDGDTEFCQVGHGAARARGGGWAGLFPGRLGQGHAGQRGGCEREGCFHEVTAGQRHREVSPKKVSKVRERGARKSYEKGRQPSLSIPTFIVPSYHRPPNSRGFLRNGRDRWTSCLFGQRRPVGARRPAWPPGDAARRCQPPGRGGGLFQAADHTTRSTPWPCRGLPA